MNGNQTYNLVIAHYRPDIVSGAENSIADLVSNIDDRFHFTMLISGQGRLANYYQERGFNLWVRQIDTPRRLYPGLHTVQSWFLAKELKKRNVQAVLCNTFPAAGRVSTAAKMARLPLAIYMRDYIPDSPANRRLLNRADAIFAISMDVKQYLSEMVNPRRVYLAYNYIQPETILARAQNHRESEERRLPFPPESPVVGLVGRITPYKQPDLFLRAVPHVLRQVPQARFVLVGTAQAREKLFEKSIRRLVEDLGIKEHVTFLGRRNDAIELTSEFTISCLVSAREPLGRVILEAQLMHVPVIVPDTGGPAEIVEDEVTGLTFSPCTEDAEVHFAHQIVRLLTNPSLRSQLADNGSERIRNTFASQKHIQVQEAYFEKLCTRGL